MFKILVRMITLYSTVVLQKHGKTVVNADANFQDLSMFI